MNLMPEVRVERICGWWSGGMKGWRNGEWRCIMRGSFPGEQRGVWARARILMTLGIILKSDPIKMQPTCICNAI